jgi:predicted dinucleotide-utilizing enzyme
VDAEQFERHRFEVHHGIGATRLKNKNKNKNKNKKTNNK